MDLKQFAHESSGFRYTYDVYVPSLGGNIKLAQMTAGNRKNLAKYGIDPTPEGFADYQLAKLSLLKSLSDGNLDEARLTDVDFVAMLAAVRMYNFVEPLTLDIKCGSCGHSFSNDVDFRGVLANAEKYKFKRASFKKKSETTGKDYEFSASNPRIMDVVALEKIASDRDGGENEFDALYPLLFVSGLKLNGEIVDNFADAPLMDRITALEGVSDGTVIFGPGSLCEWVISEFASVGPDTLFNKVKCPKCSAELEGVADTDSFFTS